MVKDFNEIVSSNVYSPFWLKKTTVNLDYSFPFEPNFVTKKAFEFSNFYDALKWRNKNEYINLLLVVGVTGSGKSNNSLEIAKKMNAYNKIKFELNKHVLLGRNVDLTLEFLAEEFCYGTYLIIDEAELVINRLNAVTIQNKEAKQTLSTIRDAGINFIFNCPNLNEIDRLIVNNQLDWLISCYHNDKKKKKVYTIIEFNARDTRTMFQEYLIHSKIAFNYIPLKEYKDYKAEKMSKLYSSEQRINNFRSIQKQRITDVKGLEKANRVQEFIKICKTKRNKTEKALRGFILNLSQSEVNELLKTYSTGGFSYAKIKSLETQALLVKNELITIKEIVERERKKKRTDNNSKKSKRGRKNVKPKK